MSFFALPLHKSLLSTSELSPSSQTVSSFLGKFKKEKKKPRGVLKCVFENNKDTLSHHNINPDNLSGSVSLCSVIAVCRPWTNISINMTRCTIDGHKDCKWSNYFYEMQHYEYINFCKNLVYLYDILKRCQNKLNSWHKMGNFLGCAAVWVLVDVWMLFLFALLWPQRFPNARFD